MDKRKQTIAKKKPVNKQVEFVWIPWLLFLANICIIQLFYLWEAGYVIYPSLQLFVTLLSAGLLCAAICLKRRAIFWIASLIYVLHILSWFV